MLRVPKTKEGAGGEFVVFIVSHGGGREFAIVGLIFAKYT